MSKSGFSTDISDFEKRTTRLVQKAMPEAAAEGGKAAGEQWKEDADNIEPKTPVKTGKLKASGKVSKPKIVGNEIKTEVSYNVPYAARVHEAESGAGAKFLESKAVRFAKKYTSIVASHIRRVK